MDERKRKIEGDLHAPSHKRERTESDDHRADIARRENTRHLAKWSHYSHEKGYEFEESKINCLLSPDERRDQSFLHDIFSGAIINSRVSPLIFEESGDDAENGNLHLRSLSFFEELLADRAQGKVKYEALSNDMKRVVGVGVRDLYLGVYQGVVDEREERILKGMTELLEEAVGCSQVGGMTVSFSPSANFKVLKFIENLDDKMRPEESSWFAQVMSVPRLFVVFVDPAELSFHNFENIVPLDRWIEAQQRQLKGSDGQQLQISLTHPNQIKPEHDVFLCKLQGSACEMIKELSALNLYVPPLNNGTRGGERFIFHSAELSRAMTDAVKASGILSQLSNGAGDLAASFAFVNYVFRCNRFSPGDYKFTNHLDTPYYDQVRSHVSKYTMLIYLTSGHGRPFLRVGDVELEEIEEMTCVIFHQSAEHEGWPFIDNEKVFIRTELVFTDESLDHNNKISSLFSEACYMTGHGVFDEELAQYAHECFERANSLHWAIEREDPQSSIYLHKCFRGMQFVTNGYDYWFKPAKGMNVVDCGVVAVLDYFNCSIAGRAFRHLSRCAPVRKQFNSSTEVWSLLEVQPEEDSETIQRLTLPEVDLLFQKRPRVPFKMREYPEGWSDEDSERDESDFDPCCPYHYYREFDAWKDKDVHQEYRKCWKYTRKKILGSPVVILGQEIRINESNISVQGDKMFFYQDANEKPLPSFNFAACWSGMTPSCMIVPGEKISAPRLLIPPLTLQESKEGFHFVLDFFRNDWMVNVDARHTVTLPVISNDLSMEDHPRTFWDEIGVDSDEVAEMSDASSDSEQIPDRPDSLPDNQEQSAESSDGDSSETW